MGVVRLCKVSASYLILAAIACIIFCSLLPVIFTVTASRSLYDYHVFCAVYMLPLFVVSYIDVICVSSICI